MINNVEFVQIDDQEETNEVVMKNFELRTVNILPR